MSNHFWTQEIALGSLKVPRFMAAPLDGVTDSPLRRLIRHFCPKELLYTEMRHVSCVANEREGRSLKYDPVEQPLAFQFSANRFEFMEQAIDKVIEHGFVMINLNAGCPAPVVIKSGSGSALMAKPETLKGLLLQFVKLINGRVPFTLKIRAGFKERNAVEIAKLAQDCGVEALIIHPRTQPDGFTSRLDFDLTRRVKEAVSMPVIFSGNLNSFAAVQRTHELTGVDGFMIGRALWGAPWKMREIIDASQGIATKVDTAMQLDYALQHLDLNLQFYGPKGFISFKKQLPQYVRSAPNACIWRTALLRSQTEAEMRGLLLQIVDEVAQTGLLPAHAGQ